MNQIENAGGILVEPENPDMLAREIEALIRDDDRKSSISQKAREYATIHLDKDKILNGFLGEVNSLLDNRA